jgi:5-formyltetrahydrofolate cyclo-ligase
VKANPDSAQWPVRQRALEDGKTVYMAVPRPAAGICWEDLTEEKIAAIPLLAAQRP